DRHIRSDNGPDAIPGRLTAALSPACCRLATVPVPRLRQRAAPRGPPSCLRIQDFYRQLSSSGTGSMVRNGQAQETMRIGRRGGRPVARRLECLQGENCDDGWDCNKDEYEESCWPSAFVAIIHGASPLRMPLRHSLFSFN